MGYLEIFDFGEELATRTGLRSGYVEFKLNSILIEFSAGYLFFLVFLFTFLVLKLDTTPPWTDQRPAAEGLAISWANIQPRISRFSFQPWLALSALPNITHWYSQNSEIMLIAIVVMTSHNPRPAAPPNGLSTDSDDSLAKA
jgi:hypothetical protein